MTQFSIVYSIQDNIDLFQISDLVMNYCDVLHMSTTHEKYTISQIITKNQNSHELCYRHVAWIEYLNVPYRLDQNSLILELPLTK